MPDTELESWRGRRLKWGQTKSSPPQVPSLRKATQGHKGRGSPLQSPAQNSSVLEHQALLLSLDKPPQPRHMCLSGSEACQVPAELCRAVPASVASSAPWEDGSSQHQRPSSSSTPTPEHSSGQRCSPLQGEGQQSEPALTNLSIKNLGRA